MNRIYRKINDNLELCFYIGATSPLSPSELVKVKWLITETFEPSQTQNTSYFDSVTVVEIGPRLSIETPFSSNAVSICHSMGIKNITRIEKTRRYKINAGQDERQCFWVRLPDNSQRQRD